MAQSSLGELLHIFFRLNPASTIDSLALQLLQGDDLTLELLILLLKLRQFLFFLSAQSAVELVRRFRVLSNKDTDILIEKLLDLELLHFLLKSNLLILNNCLLIDEGLDFLISVLHLVLLDLDFPLESDHDVIVSDLVHEIVSQSLDFVLQFHILLFFLLNVILEFLDGRIAKESILEALGAHESAWGWGVGSWVEAEACLAHGLLDSNWLGWLLSILGLGDQVERNDALSDHLRLHQNVFVVGRVVVLDLLSDFIKVGIGWISPVSPLELVDPLDVLGLELVSVDLESLESLNINWFVEVEVIVLLGCDQLLLLLVLCFILVLVKDFLKFLK